MKKLGTATLFRLKYRLRRWQALYAKGTSGSEKGPGSPYERRLVRRLQAGDREALDTLFEMYVDQVYAYACHLLRNREDAEEVVSEAFLRAFERAFSYREEAPFRAWLFGIVRNLCRDRMRQPRLLLLEPKDAERYEDGGRPDLQVENALIVRQALERLPEDQRLVLMLCDVEEWDAREAAEMMDRSVEATKSLLYRARRALCRALTEMLEEGENEGALR